MAEFKDNEGRLWHPKMDLDACERFERAVGKSFFSLAHEIGPQELAASVRHVVPLLFACLDTEATERSVGYTDFRAGLDNGIVLTAAVVAMSEAMRDFFPTPPKAKRKTARKRSPKAGRGPGKTFGDSPPSQESGTPDG